MADFRIYDLNDEKQFPVLHGLVKYLDKFTPYQMFNIYWNKQYDQLQYNGEINENAETLEQTTNDINRAIGKIKRSILGMIISEETSNYINKLIKERDYLFAINIPGKDQRDFNVKTYNRYVTGEIDRYCNFIQDRLEVTFSPYFKNPEKERLNIKISFRILYEKFGVNDESENIEPIQSNHIKLNWIGQKNQLYNVLRQLKDSGLIGNSYNSLADFLIENVTGFENTKKNTIETEFKRNKEPTKPKRIKIETGEAE